MDSPALTNQELLKHVEQQIEKIKEYCSNLAAETNFSCNCELCILNARIATQGMYTTILALLAKEVRPETSAYLSVSLEEINHIMCSMEQQYRSLLLTHADFVRNINR